MVVRGLTDQIADLKFELEIKMDQLEFAKATNDTVVQTILKQEIAKIKAAITALSVSAMPTALTPPAKIGIGVGVAAALAVGAFFLLR